MLAGACLMALLPACAQTDASAYPSLAIRPAERIDADPPTEPPAPPAPVPADVMARVAAIKAKADDAASAFDRLSPGVTARVQSGRGAAVASDRWIDAQVAFSQLDTARTGTATALADIDIIYIERAVALESRAEIESVRQEIASLLERQDAVLARLKATVGQ